MTDLRRWLTTRWWIAVVAGAFALSGWRDAARITHVNHISELAGGDRIAIDATSPTGYQFGFRKLIVPEKNPDSFQWIMQAQKMFESGNWRLTRADYDNAPDGRSIRTASPYRWWLGSIAWIDHILFQNPIGISVERAALVADPILQAILLLACSVFIARHFGGPSAALFALGFVSIFPLGTAFSPGQPDDSTFALAAAIWSVLPLAASIYRSLQNPTKTNTVSTQRLFLVSGIASGIGMWIGVSSMFTLLIGITIAGAAMGVTSSRIKSDDNESPSETLPWRMWAFGGATVTFFAWLIERSPALFDSASWQSDFVHPLYSIAWLGAGELLIFLSSPRKTLSKLQKIVLAGSTLSVVGLVYTITFHGSAEGWSIDPIENRLTRLPEDPGVTNVGTWISQDSGKGMLLATLTPLAVLLIGIFAWIQRRTSNGEMRLFALLLVPTFCILIAAMSQLGWWHQLGALSLVVAASLLPLKSNTPALRWSCVGAVFLSAALGVSYVYSNIDEASTKTVNRAELETLIERHLAQWLAQHSEVENPVALAPPITSVSLAYFGGLRGIGTPFPENVEGFSVGVRLCAASSADEAKALATGREVSLIVHPSWDPFLEEYARLGTDKPENSFIAMLNRWLAPRWLEPVSYQLPSVAGFEEEWVTVFRSVEVQDNASAIGRLVEYFLDTGRGELAFKAQKALETNFADELVTHITAAEVALSIGDRDTFNRSINSILRSIESGSDFYLSWEFRVSMTLLLANANQIEETKAQLERCLSEAKHDSLRRLSTPTLGRMLHLAKVLQLDFPDTPTRDYAISLLPPTLQEGL